MQLHKGWMLRWKTSTAVSQYPNVPGKGCSVCRESAGNNKRYGWSHVFFLNTYQVDVHLNRHRSSRFNCFSRFSTPSTVIFERSMGGISTLFRKPFPGTTEFTLKTAFLLLPLPFCILFLEAGVSWSCDSSHRKKQCSTQTYFPAVSCWTTGSRLHRSSFVSELKIGTELHRLIYSYSYLLSYV